MDDPQREIVGDVWKELGNRIVITYVDGESDRVRAGRLVAAEVASDAGLTIVSTGDGASRWVKDPDVWDG